MDNKQLAIETKKRLIKIKEIETIRRKRKMKNQIIATLIIVIIMLLSFIFCMLKY